MNKVSLFDKDMMFLIIFGLRGFKHELDSRIGLRCASELNVTFKTWLDIVNVSMGVTSGMSYCGVVGHTLRREYSVISVTVNKAARLMMAYPNIVSCDQETLLLSNLYMKHFTLLPKKLLRGLKEEVFAYEFKEIFDDIVMEKPLKYNFPILDRNEILAISRKLLISAISNINQEKSLKVSCLLIKGESQQGKTRMLNEIFSNCFDDNLRCLRLSLNIKHSKVPYKVISKIMEKALNLNGPISTEAMQEIITQKLTGFNVDGYFSVFNSIFGTNFEVSEIVKTMEEDNFTIIQKMMFKILCTQAFQEFLVVLINDAEYLDKYSFELLECLFDCDEIFIFLVLGSQRKISADQRKILHENSVTQYRLESIDTIYQNQLACQFLNVEGLSLNLEEYLHKSSKGNPGWMETFTVSLLRSGKMEIKSMSIIDAFRMGVTLNNLIDPFEKSSNKEDCMSIQHEYQLFNQCYKNSSFIQHNQTNDKLIKVAILQNVPLQNEFLMNSRTDSELMTFDSLSSYEQLMCKCASVAGFEFTRHMLFFIMSSSTDRMIGKAMVKLFELQIFVCASGIETGHNKSSSGIITCNCKDLKVFDSCRDLPRYASCALVRFHSEVFRNVVYDLLTDKQRLEYHKRSLLYLHMETMRCESCGGGMFTSLMALDIDFKFHDGFLDHEDKSFESMVNYFESINVNIKLKKKPNIFKKMFKPWISSKKSTKIRPIILNFMNYDFRNCKCSMILYSMYNEMIRHCHGAMMNLKLIDSKIELARMCIKMNNIPRASSLLFKALQKLEVSCSALDRVV